MKKRKICMISSSGGHFEELSMLKKLGEQYDLFWVTEAVDYQDSADYYLIQSDMKDKWMITKMVVNGFRTVKFWIKEKPCVVITTGTLVALPACLLARILRKKVIYIESFSRVWDCTRAGKIMYYLSDLFVFQWETLKELYPKGVYGGSIF